MAAETQSSESSRDCPRGTVVNRNRRVEDELRLRELELQTDFQIKTLTESFSLLKNDFHSWRDSLNDKVSKVDQQVEGLKNRVFVVIALIVIQMFGAPQFLGKLLGGL